MKIRKPDILEYSDWDRKLKTYSRGGDGARTGGKFTCLPGTANVDVNEDRRLRKNTHQQKTTEYHHPSRWGGWGQGTENDKTKNTREMEDMTGPPSTEYHHPLQTHTRHAASGKSSAVYETSRAFSRRATKVTRAPAESVQQIQLDRHAHRVWLGTWGEHIGSIRPVQRNDKNLRIGASRGEKV